MPFQIDKEKTKKNIALIRELMQTEADPRTLAEYRAVFKKHVSLFRRSWVSAYLLMLFEQGVLGSRDTSARTGKAAVRRNAALDDNSAEGRRYLLAEEESKRLFFSAGRNRRVFPREILGLINSRTAIPKEDIGSIRILDNYSFVQVRNNVAERIIEALNGYMFRGRPLSVNYAKERDEEDPENDV